jgi:hypothetical protein
MRTSPTAFGGPRPSGLVTSAGYRSLQGACLITQWGCSNLNWLVSGAGVGRVGGLVLVGVAGHRS